MLKPLKGLLPVLVAGWMIAACSAGKKAAESGVWVNEEEMKGRTFHKVFIVAMTADPQVRVRLEKTLAEAIESKGIQAVKSFEVIPPSLDNPQKPAKDSVIQQVKATGCDAAFVAALIKKEEAVHYTPGSTTYTWQGNITGYYDLTYSTVTHPGYYTDEKSYVMQSNLYDAANGNTILSVVSPVFNPTSMDKFSQSYMSTLVKQLQKARVLKK